MNETNSTPIDLGGCDSFVYNFQMHNWTGGPVVISVKDQIASLSYQYMRMLLIMSAITFIYVVYNYLFRFDSPLKMRIGRAFDAGMIVVSAFMLVVSVIYFTGWY